MAGLEVDPSRKFENLPWSKLLGYPVWRAGCTRLQTRRVALFIHPRSRPRHQRHGAHPEILAIGQVGGDALGLDEVEKGTAPRDELLVRPLFHDALLAQDHNAVGALRGRQAVGNHQDGPVSARGAQGGLDEVLGDGVQRRGRLVEEQDLGVGDERPRDGHALPLPAREERPAVADHRVVPVGLRDDKVVRAGLGGRRDDQQPLPLRRVATARLVQAECDVLVDGGVEQDGLLADDGHVAAQPFHRELVEAMPVKLDGAVLRVVKPLQQAEYGALSTARGPDQSGGLARFDGQI